MVALVGMALFWAVPLAIVGGAIAWFVAPQDAAGGAVLLGAVGFLYGWRRGRRMLAEEAAMRARAGFSARRMVDDKLPPPGPRPAGPAPSRQRIDDLVRRIDRQGPTDELFDELFDITGVRQQPGPAGPRPGSPPQPEAPRRPPREHDPELALTRTAEILDRRGAADPALLGMLMDRYRFDEPRSARRVARRIVFHRLPEQEVRRLFPAGPRFPDLTDREREAITAELRADPGVEAWSVGVFIPARPTAIDDPGTSRSPSDSF